MNATHHDKPANSARHQQRRKILAANAPYLALIPIGIVTFYPPVYPYAGAVYFASCIIFGCAIFQELRRWTGKAAKPVKTTPS
ncbi:hypothetical protein [Rhodanobacter thiooxydans]|uniref:hypothetical protein n=1 Tax=Rhodanobacter thiooxydans TaxID=416169 RepID=UPI000D334E01|nr:hypothetical protein [Rhodanobacter thiooxydans]